MNWLNEAKFEALYNEEVQYLGNQVDPFLTVKERRGEEGRFSCQLLTTIWERRLE